LPIRASLKTLSSISPSTQWAVSLGRAHTFEATWEVGMRDFVRENPIAHLDPPIRVLSNES
jgi:hypothetical protein